MAITNERREPDDALTFIYHVNMRMRGRFIEREQILGAAASYEIIESNPGDKYLPSYLIHATAGGRTLHVLFAADVEGDNVRVVTAYRPDPAEWDDHLKRRRAP